MKTSVLSFFLGTVLFNTLTIAQPNFENWPAFRGTNCTGIASQNQDPPITFNPEKNVLWKISLPGGHSSPCIWGDHIFISAYQNEGKLLKMICIDRQNGKAKWEEDIAVEAFEKFNSVSNPAAATPVTDGERVCFYFCSFGLICYDFKGKLQWKFPMAVPKTQANNGVGSSPIIYDDKVIVNCFGHLNDTRLLAINKYNGKIIWQNSIPNTTGYGNSSATPVIYKDQIIVYRSVDIAGYSLKTGDCVWNYAVDNADAVGTPVIQNDILYFIAYCTAGNPDLNAQIIADYKEFRLKYDANKDFLIDKNEAKNFTFLLYPEMGDSYGKTNLSAFFPAFDIDKNEYLDSTEWRTMHKSMASYYSNQGLKAIKLGGKGELSLNNFIWGNQDQISHVSSALYYNNHVYMVRDGGIISCFESKNGKLLYRGKLNTPGAYFSSPIAAKGRIYIASRNGIISVLDSGEKFKILAQNNIKEGITATPAIVDNKIYVRTEKALFAFGKQ